MSTCSNLADATAGAVPERLRPDQAGGIFRMDGLRKVTRHRLIVGLSQPFPRPWRPTDGGLQHGDVFGRIGKDKADTGSVESAQQGGEFVQERLALPQIVRR